MKLEVASNTSCSVGIDSTPTALTKDRGQERIEEAERPGSMKPVPDLSLPVALEVRREAVVKQRGRGPRLRRPELLVNQCQGFSVGHTPKLVAVHRR